MVIGDGNDDFTAFKTYILKRIFGFGFVVLLPSFFEGGVASILPCELLKYEKFGWGPYSIFI